MARWWWLLAYLVRQVIDGKRSRTSCYSLSRVANLSPCRTSLSDDGADSGAAAAGRLSGVQRVEGRSFNKDGRRSFTFNNYY